MNIEYEALKPEAVTSAVQKGLAYRSNFGLDGYGFCLDRLGDTTRIPAVISTMKDLQRAMTRTFFITWVTFFTGLALADEKSSITYAVSGTLTTPTSVFQATLYAFDRKWGHRGAGDGEFDAPWGIAVDTGGNVYVTELTNERVQKFSPVH